MDDQTVHEENSAKGEEGNAVPGYTGKSSGGKQLDAKHKSQICSFSGSGWGTVHFCSTKKLIRSTYCGAWSFGIGVFHDSFAYQSQ